MTLEHEIPATHSPVPRRLSRRTLLHTGVALPVAVGAWSIFSPAVARADTLFDQIILKFQELKVGADDSDVTDPVVQEKLEAVATACEGFQALLVAGTDRDRVFSDLPLANITRSAAIQTTADRLSRMAQAWATPGSRLRHDPAVSEQVIAGLETLHELQYHADKVPFDNWYHWEIGTPRHVVTTMVLIRPVLPADLQASLLQTFFYFNPRPGYGFQGDKSSGSNLMLRVQNAIVAGALSQDTGHIDEAVDASLDALVMNTSGTGNGFYFDGSFLFHDNVPYSLGYGEQLVTSASNVIPLVAGTGWDYQEADIDPLRTAVTRNFLPWVSHMQNLPPVRGRLIATGTGSAGAILGSILKLAEGAPVEQAELWQAAVKGHLIRSTRFDFSTRALPELRLALRLLADDSVEARPEELGPRLFPKMDRVLSRGPGWCVSLATGSTRTRGFETANRENIKGWHQGSGARYLFADIDQNQHPALFPTIDPYRMPGTTVDTQEMTESRYEDGQTLDAFVGGVQIGGHREPDGFYAEPFRASWVQALSSKKSSMTAKLSWFFFGSQIVHLGADIRGGSGSPVETVIENRALTAGGQTLSINGVAVPAADTPRWSETRNDVTTFHVSKAAGVVVMDGPEVHFLHDQREGSFKDISPLKGSATVQHNDFHTVWMDHGSAPSGSRFAYRYLPLASVAETEAAAVDGDITILANTAQVQAIHSRDDRVVAAHFHEAVDVGCHSMVISGAEEVCVMVREVGVRRDIRQVALSDPTQGRDTFTVTITDPRLIDSSVADVDSTVDVTADGRSIVVTVDVSARDGATHEFSLQLQ